MEFIYIIIGFALLIKASEYFVDASTDIAKIFKVSDIIIGATIVSIGTTLPETMVSATSAFRGHGDIAYGNAIGSIICNTAFVSAISLLFSKNKINRKDLIAPVIFLFSSFVLYVIFAYTFKSFSRVSGITLVSIFVIYVLYIIFSNKNNELGIVEIKAQDSIQNSIDKNNTSVLKSIAIIIVSAFVIAFASNLLVDNGTLIAQKYGVAESVIGITIIALGTSLPELSTAITSIVKGHGSLSIGNIVGANFFNIVLVTGISSVISPFKVPKSNTIDIPVAFIVMSILCIPSLINRKTSRLQGIALIIIYICFIIYQYKL